MQLFEQVRINSNVIAPGESNDVLVLYVHKESSICFQYFESYRVINLQNFLTVLTVKDGSRIDLRGRTVYLFDLIRSLLSALLDLRRANCP